MRRRNLIVAIAMLALLGALLWNAIRTGSAPQQSNAVEPPAPPAAPRAEPPPPAAQRQEPEGAEDGGDVHPPLVGEDEEPDAAPFSSIDLDAARAALPDNAYWENLAPTADPRLLGDRERAQKHWNDQYGKILAGDATPDEIKEFFDRRMRLSSDYVRFVDWVIEHQGSTLSDSDLELLHVAKRMHLARLEEVPRRMQEALDKKAKQDAARAEWQEQQRELESDSESPSPDGGDADANGAP